MSKWFLLLMVIVSLSFPSFAQNNNQMAVVRLGRIDSSYTTLTRILSDPRVMSTDPNCKVIEFSVLFTAAGGTTYGPYQTMGSEMTDQQKIMLKELSGGKVKITIDPIKLICGGDRSQEIWVRPVELWYGN